MAVKKVTWTRLLASEKEDPQFQSTLNMVADRRKTQIVYPSRDLVFHALDMTPYNKVKVVILGQDPYHGPGQAHGLSFSVPDGVKVPPSLRNIKKEIQQDLRVKLSSSGCLNSWAQQGVLLLNSVLTVEGGKPQSHAKIGWQRFTDRVISSLNDHHKSIVFMLWGAYAQKKSQLISNSHHLILTAPHPSPLSAHRGFLGCRHFSQCNAWLVKHHRDEINWVV